MPHTVLSCATQKDLIKDIFQTKIVPYSSKFDYLNRDYIKDKY